MKFSRILSGLALAALIGLIPAGAEASSLCDADLINLVKNCGFELSPQNAPTLYWTDALGYNKTWVSGNLGYLSNSGSEMLSLGASGVVDTESQTLTTVAGQAYSISFFYWSDGLPANNTFLSMSFGGTTVFSQANLPYTPVYAQFTGTAVATSSATVLSIGGRNDNGYLLVDDVQVDPTASPEPGSMFLLGSGLLCVVMAARQISKH